MEENMSSILGAIRDLVTPDLVARMSAHTGESEAMVSKGFGAAIPLLLSSLAGKADDTSFMSQLAGIAAGTADDTNALTRLPQVVTGASPIDTATTTGRWLSSLFGSNLGGVIDGVARFAGVGTGSSASLLSMAAPIVLGYLGRLMRSDNLGSTGLTDLLRSQSSAFAAAVPSGLASLLPAARVPADVARTVPPDTIPAAVATAARSNRGWAVPLLVGALAIGGLMWWNGRHHVQPPQTARVETQTSFELPKPIGTSGTIATPAIPAPSIDWMKFERIEFNNGSAVLTSASREHISKIAEALTAHPGAHIRIAGYTDVNGNEAANVTLSRARAHAVRDALRSKGIVIDRIQAEGYGSQNPLADNATEEGRAQNRRVTVEVTER
jgi:outer membrane protein OmpA-like peptidoglycan-associated protein